MKVVFMGTPDFAAESLESLIKAGHEICAVFTQPDKPVGRRQVLTAPPVKQTALKYGLPVYQPTTLKTGESTEIIRELSPDVCAVVAYGKLLPDKILEIPKFGCVNVHASLLPKYRGASPIQWAIVCGEKQTGVCTMRLDHGMDTGDVILTKTESIRDDDTAESLWDRLSAIGADALCETLNLLDSGKATFTPQDDSLASYAPIIKKSDGLLDFNKSAYMLDCLIRGLHSWPVAFTFADGKRLKVYKAKPIQHNSAKPYEIIDESDELLIGCGGGTALIIEELQAEGSKRMSAEDFLRGKKIGSIGDTANG